MKAGPVIPRLIVFLLLAACAVALYKSSPVKLALSAGVRLGMPATANGWVGRQVMYCHNPGCGWAGLVDVGDADRACALCSGPLEAMSPIEKAELPADTEFAKYEYSRLGGGRLQANIVLSGRERSSIHRPQRCLVAQGYEVLRSSTETIALGEGDVKVMLLETMRHVRRAGAPSEDRPARLAYWFVGGRRSTPFHLVRMFWTGWDRLFHGTACRWAYVIVLQYGEGSRSAFARDLESFLPHWYPQILTEDGSEDGAGEFPRASQ